MHMTRLRQIAAPGEDVFGLQEIALIIPHRPGAVPGGIQYAGEEAVIKGIIYAGGPH